MFVISLGGSIVVPDAVDSGFVARFVTRIGTYLQDRDERMVIVVGGGAPARTYQSAYRNVCEELDHAADHDAQDWIGVMATRLNAELVRHAFGALAPAPVVIDPTGPLPADGKVLVAAGWKPGFSTDYDAVVLAERIGADTVVNLSNIAQVYSADPKLDPTARPLERVSWAEFRAIVGETWTPGGNLPFDPVATRRAQELGLRVLAAAGRDLDNTEAILHGKPFVGTQIGPT